MEPIYNVFSSHYNAFTKRQLYTLTYGNDHESMRMDAYDVESEGGESRTPCTIIFIE